MKIAVWDSHVPRADEDRTMHFDILVPDGTAFTDVKQYGQDYLIKKGQSGQPLTASECQYCHSESADPDVLAAIDASGYTIIEMENC